MSRPSLLFLLCAALLAGGCMQTAMLPAQQLDSGTTVASLNLDEPGTLYIPRGNLQLTRGFGGGDLSANISGPPFGGGLTGRYYFTDRLNGELQVQGAFLGDGPMTGLLLAGVQEAPTGSDNWYIGAQIGAIRGPGFDFLVAESKIYTLPVVGASVGAGPFNLGGSWQMQLEVEGNKPLFAPDDASPLPPVRVSIGFFHLFK